MRSQVYLASRSPRRAELLAQIGVAYQLLDAEVDERARPGESPAEYVVRLARDKARAGAAHHPRGVDRPVLAADTAVVVDDRVLGKPADRAQALEMMALLSGRSHQVMTGIALHWSGSSRTRLSTSIVSFREVAAAEAERYWRSGEPVDKAGGYAIQGLGALFISHLDGSYSGVMGLPLFETAELLAAAGIQNGLGSRETDASYE